MNKASKYFLFALLLIIIDQVIKLWMHYIVVPQHFGNIDLIPSVFKLHYVLNPGMAFGIELDDLEIVKKYLPEGSGKLLLSVFRLVATVGISWYLYFMAQKTPKSLLLWAVAAILAGALGNVIDSTFYGQFITGNIAPNAPYPWFHGQVIDMFYFYFLDGFWPDWFPLWGGQYHSTPIFNFADACIFCGVVVLLIFQKNFFENEETAVPETTVSVESTDAEELKINEQ
jgi:signal peptidase II